MKEVIIRVRREHKIVLGIGDGFETVLLIPDGYETEAIISEAGAEFDPGIGPARPRVFIPMEDVEVLSEK